MTGMTRFSLLSLVTLLPYALALTANTTYQISPSSYPNLCLASTAATDGSPLIVKDCSSSDTVFTFTGASLENTETQLCVDVTDGKAKSGNKLQVWGCFNNNANQAFEVDGEAIAWMGKGYCLDLTDGKGVSGTKVQIWSCASANPNQFWTFTEVEEIDDCEDGETGTELVSSSVSFSASPTTSSVSVSSSASDSIPATDSVSATDSSASASATDSAIGGNLLAANNGGGHHQNPNTKTTSTTAFLVATSTGSATATGTHTTSTSTGAAAGSTATASTSSGYLQTSGTSIVDSNGNKLVLKGTNLGGWLVLEDWMCGITDNSGNADRFAQETLESRFGASQTANLIAAWQNSFLTSADFDNLAALGFNLLRLPFSWRTLQNADGSWIANRYDKLDWAIAQAKSRGMYVVPTFHIWSSQQAAYSQISENTDAGNSDRQAAAAIWVDVATHYLGESAIAGFDVINEPTGSYANNLQQALYNAVRSVDKNRIIVMESISTDPRTYGWTNVVYSEHQYLMMTDSESQNQNAWWNGGITDINTWESYGIPAYMGEFMAMNPTLPWLMDQLNTAGIWWTAWTYKTVNMGGWGLFNLPGSASVDVSSDSYDSILKTWSNLGTATKNTDIWQVYKNAAAGSTSQKRDLDEATKRTKEFHGVSARARDRAAVGQSHVSRSRRHTMLHGKKASF